MDTWTAMEAILSTGKVRAIGISNFSQTEVEKFLSHGRVPPAVHQMELHPYLSQPSFCTWHADQKIQLIQFNPLENQNTFYRHAQRQPKVIDNAVLKYVGRKYGKSPVQVALA